MEKKELQQTCKEKRLLIDDSLLEEISLVGDKEIIEFFLEKIRTNFKRSFFNKRFFEENKKKISSLLEEVYLSLGKNFSKEKRGEKKGAIQKKGYQEKKEGTSSVKIKTSLVREGKSFDVKDFVTHFRNRFEFLRDVLSKEGGLDNLISIGKLSGEKQKFSVIGMVVSKRETKNKNLILEIEDLTGRMKVILNSDKEDLLKEAEDIGLDSVVGFSGFGSREIMFVQNFYFPEARVVKRKKSLEEEVVLFIGDVHFGSKNFLKKDFEKFIEYLSEKGPKESRKVKYLFIVGDLITGVGNYPNQEEDLRLVNLEDQFIKIAEVLSRIRKDIKIILSPGNHDCVRLMEPQPMLDPKYAWPLYDLENVVMTENPCVVNLGGGKNFEGFDVLTYHGFSFPHFANTVSHLLEIKAMNQPEKIMKHLLKHRHLAPTHNATQYFPLEHDGMLIRDSPDIFVSGHTHKSGITYFNDILVVSVSSWEGKTSYQEKFGNEPDHCKVPSFNLKTRQVRILDFETKEGEDGS